VIIGENMSNANDVDTTEKKVIHADPTKDFFVNMITRDIATVDCIFDLLDNSIDGARRYIANGNRPFESFKISVKLNAHEFTISDNCGGITLADAINHAFHFGRKSGSSNDVKGGIGLYGIGMKRALFKIGRMASVTSHSADDSFKVPIDVNTWLANETNWDFPWEPTPTVATKGTTISIWELNSGVGDAFGDSMFIDELRKAIARDYTFFLDKGLTIEINDTAVASYRYGLKQNANIEPGVRVYEDDGVQVRIIAGIIEDLPDDIPEEVRPGEVERQGWYVICNDRVVLAGDKTDKTVWGNDNFQVWHPQYNGFAGFVFFSSLNQAKLPWTTTKRDLDDSSPLYRRTIAKMKELTVDFIKYSNQRKPDLQAAKNLESNATMVDVYSYASDAPRETPLRLPQLVARTGPPMVNISYKRLKSEVDEVKKELGDPFMSNVNAGIATFDYFRRMELGK
jgi:hypothetical protein